MNVPPKRTQNVFGRARRSSSKEEDGIGSGVFMAKKTPAHLSAGRVRKSSVWKWNLVSHRKRNPAEAALGLHGKVIGARNDNAPTEHDRACLNEMVGGRVAEHRGGDAARHCGISQARRGRLHELTPQASGS